VFVLVQPAPFNSYLGVAQTAASETVTVLDRIGKLDFQLGVISCAIIHVEERQLEVGLMQELFYCEPQVDLPVSIPRRAGVVGDQRWPALCQRRRQGTAQDQKN